MWREGPCLLGLWEDLICKVSLSGPRCPTPALIGRRQCVSGHGVPASLSCREVRFPGAGDAKGWASLSGGFGVSPPFLAQIGPRLPSVY